MTEARFEEFKEKLKRYFLLVLRNIGIQKVYNFEQFEYFEDYYSH